MKVDMIKIRGIEVYLLASHTVFDVSMFCFCLADSHADMQIFLYLLISCHIVNSCYTLIWDLKMDWGLFDRNAGENMLLREEIVYPQKVNQHHSFQTLYCSAG